VQQLLSYLLDNSINITQAPEDVFGVQVASRLNVTRQQAVASWVFTPWTQLRGTAFPAG
jgi:hypothetical protein